MLAALLAALLMTSACPLSSRSTFFNGIFNVLLRVSLASSFPAWPADDSERRHSATGPSLWLLTVEQARRSLGLQFGMTTEDWLAQCSACVEQVSSLARYCTLGQVMVGSPLSEGQLYNLHLCKCTENRPFYVDI